jgi:hypothetical protein
MTGISKPVPQFPNNQNFSKPTRGSSNESNNSFGSNLRGFKKARAYYITGMPGTDKNDEIHLYVPELYEGPRLTEPLIIRIGGSFSRDQEGIILTGAWVVKMDPHSLEGIIEGSEIGRLTFTVRRELGKEHGNSTKDVLNALGILLLPAKIQIATVEHILSSAELPGNSMGGHGPGGRQRGPEKPDQPASGNRPPESSHSGGSGSGKKPPEEDKEEQEKK